MEKSQFSGIVNITMAALKPNLETLVLDVLDMKIVSVSCSVQGTILNYTVGVNTWPEHPEFGYPLKIFRPLLCASKVSNY